MLSMAQVQERVQFKGVDGVVEAASSEYLPQKSPEHAVSVSRNNVRNRNRKSTSNDGAQAVYVQRTRSLDINLARETCCVGACAFVSCIRSTLARFWRS